MSVEIKRFGNPETGTEQGIYKGNLSIAINVTAQAKALVPVDKGQLRNSLMYKVGKPGGGVTDGGFNNSPGESAVSEITVSPKSDSGYVGANTEYAPYQEFGTRKMAPQPYLRPAIAIAAKGADTMRTLAKIEREQMNGALKGIKKFQIFREKF